MKPRGPFSEAHRKAISPWCSDEGQRTITRPGTDCDKDVTPAEEESLGDCIRQSATGMQKLQRMGVNKKAIMVLLVHETRLGHKTNRRSAVGIG